MSRVLPILFNTDMVMAILDGRKTVTRRLVKASVLLKVEPPKKVSMKNGVANFEWNTQKTAGGFEIKAPYQPGDILYVRETWRKQTISDGCEEYQYRADFTDEENACYGRRGGFAPRSWRPSIHMPKEAARIWLKVKDVRVERLDDMTVNDAISEGINMDGLVTNKGIIEYRVWNRWNELWDSTIPKKDMDKYGSEANPWVWVIEFERCEKPEEFVK